MDLNVITNQRRRLVETNVDFLQNKVFLEFGVCTGKSMLEYHWLYASHNIQADFYGFDSFEGLPEETKDEKSPWVVGEFSMHKHINPELLTKTNIKIKDGWYSATLNEELSKELKGKKAGIIHIDCDIYTSTLEVLEYVVQNDLLAEGTILVYDDWGVWRQVNLTEQEEYSLGEGRAHKEVCEKYNLQFDLINKDVVDPTFYEIATFVYKGKK